MISEIYLVLAAALGGFLTKGTEWIFTRHNLKEDTKAKEIENEVRLSDYYKDMVDDLEPRYASKYEELSNRHEKRYESMCSLYDSKEKIMKDEIALLKSKINMLKAENASLRRRVQELENKV